MDENYIGIYSVDVTGDLEIFKREGQAALDGGHDPH